MYHHVLKFRSSTVAFSKTPSLSKGCRGSTTYASRSQTPAPEPRSSGRGVYSDSFSGAHNDEVDEELRKQTRFAERSFAVVQAGESCYVIHRKRESFIVHQVGKLMFFWRCSATTFNRDIEMAKSPPSETGFCGEQIAVVYSEFGVITLGSLSFGQLKKHLPGIILEKSRRCIPFTFILFEGECGKRVALK